MRLASATQALRDRRGKSAKERLSAPRGGGSALPVMYATVRGGRRDGLRRGVSDLRGRGNGRRGRRGNQRVALVLDRARLRDLRHGLGRGRDSRGVRSV